MNIKSLGIIAVLILLALAAGGWEWLVAKPQAPDPKNRQLVSEGENLYRQSCASCHGENLQGQPNWRQRLSNGRLPAPPHDASGHTWHHKDEQLLQIISDGLAATAPPGYQTDMPSFGDKLNDHQIVAILAYIKSRWPEDIQHRQAALSNR